MLGCASAKTLSTYQELRPQPFGKILLMGWSPYTEERLWLESEMLKRIDSPNDEPYAYMASDFWPQNPNGGYLLDETTIETVFRRLDAMGVEGIVVLGLSAPTTDVTEYPFSWTQNSAAVYANPTTGGVGATVSSTTTQGAFRFYDNYFTGAVSVYDMDASRFIWSAQIQTHSQGALTVGAARGKYFTELRDQLAKLGYIPH